MATLTVTVPDDVRDFIEASIGDDYVDAGAVVTGLVREHMDGWSVEELRAIVDDARASGISERTTEEIFAEAVEVAKARGTYRD